MKGQLKGLTRALLLRSSRYKILFALSSCLRWWPQVGNLNSIESHAKIETITFIFHLDLYLVELKNVRIELEKFLS